ncbi:LOW QUALITY PROTEIN: acetyl-coenzyme A transporter 1-like [Babylonia areolata]|uniref:LOW QUALITY PROTEIN: acetyl-coenzyme A transporter 1-like n=1 Tax=Babylonia areolata TaxID=304850 RepID=UPI003FD51EA0
MLRVLSVFVEELLRPLVLHPPPPAPLPTTMGDINNSQMETRKRGMPMVSVEHTDLESDAFPHMPLAAPAEELDEKGKVRPAGQLRNDLGNIMLLMFLYILQGIPLGLAGSIPMLLQSRKVTYTEQAMFSFVYWPFSIKLLWAPLVDSLYLRWFGRRKTWLIPTQYLIGLFMMVLSYRIHAIMEDGQVDIFYLTVIFFMLNFLAATQDIAVDGWALTMLSRENVGWASTCNTVGQTAGYFLGNVLFLALESADFCNNYLRWEPQPEGVITLGSFLYFWGVVFFVTTTLVGLVKPERADPDVDPEQGIVDTYKTLLRVIRLPSVMSYALILLTAKVTFSAADALTGLKLIESGMPKERLALFAVPMVPIQIFLPLMISKYTHGPRPLDIFLKAYPYRVLLGPLYALLVYWSHYTQTTPGEFPWYFYVVTLMAYGIHQVFVYMIFVAQMAFHAKISDPAIGGTYMTLLNTVANLGGNWPTTFTLWLVDHLTFKHCDTTDLSCNSKETEAACTEAGGKCVTTQDGYFILIAVCFVIGFVWLAWRRNRMRQLDSLPQSAWKCS